MAALSADSLIAGIYPNGWESGDMDVPTRVGSESEICQSDELKPQAGHLLESEGPKRALHAPLGGVFYRQDCERMFGILGVWRSIHHDSRPACGLPVFPGSGQDPQNLKILFIEAAGLGEERFSKPAANSAC